MGILDDYLITCALKKLTPLGTFETQPHQFKSSTGMPYLMLNDLLRQENATIGTNEQAHLCLNSLCEQEISEFHGRIFLDNHGNLAYSDNSKTGSITYTKTGCTTHTTILIRRTIVLFPYDLSVQEASAIITFGSAMEKQNTSFEPFDTKRELPKLKYGLHLSISRT